MSTELFLFGTQITIENTTIFILTGFFGGFFPLIYDLLHRQKQPRQEKIELGKEFWAIKALLIPLIAFIITFLAVFFDNITSWVAALYLGASLPVLIEKVVGSSTSTVNNLTQDQ